MDVDWDDLYLDLREQCEREGHLERYEGGTGVLITICRRCGADMEQEQEQAA